jgi:Uma2 family endonuclease
MTHPVKILPHYTYSDYVKWEGRWELIEGIPYAMSPAPNPKHQKISARFFTVFGNALNASGCKECELYNFIDFVTEEDTVVQPDALIVCKEIEKKYLDFPPALVLEILSPSTAMKDRNNKFYIYQSQKIPYYLIVDTDTNKVDIYHLNADNKYELQSYDAAQPYHFQLEQHCEISVVLNEIWR